MTDKAFPETLMCSSAGVSRKDSGSMSPMALPLRSNRLRFGRLVNKRGSM